MSARDRARIPRLIWSLLRPRWRLFLGVLLLIPVGGLLELVHPFVLRRVIDDHLTVGRAEGLGGLAAVYVLAFVSMQGVAFVQTYLAASVGQNALRDLRIRLFRHFELLPVAYFDQTPSGDVISRCTADVDAVGMLFSSTLLGVFAQLVRLVGVVGAMVALNPRLALTALIAVPIVAGISHIFRPRMLAAERAVRRRVAETNTHIQEDVTGVEVIRAFGAEDAFERRFRDVQRGFLEAIDRSSRYDSIFSPLIDTLKALTIALLLWYGTRPEVYLSWGITLGTLAAFVQLLNGFFRPITALGQEYQTVQRAVAGAERIFAVLSLPPEERPPAMDVVPDRAAPDVEVTGVTFAYTPGNPVLHDIDLRIRPGEHVAVVGPTGAGKSSLMHLLAGIYRPDSGTIRVGGHDPRNLVSRQRGRLVGVVPQHVHLFEGTILENLRLGNEDISEERVWEALDLANAGDMVRALDEGLHTPLGVAGLTLSAGQRQLLALARALVRDPVLLLMDEATSAVDSETERLIRAGVARSSSGKTMLTVAHRLSFAQETDRVIVMGDGRIIEEGPPDVLARGSGWYAGMLELQLRGWSERG